MSLEGVNGEGKRLSEDQIMFSIKNFCKAARKEADYEKLAHEVGFDLDKAA